MKKNFILLNIFIGTILLTSCTSRGEIISDAYLKVDRYDGISRQEAIAIAEYYFSYKQSAFPESSFSGSKSVYVDRNPEELRDNWKFRIVSKLPNVDVYVSYLVNRKDGQVKEINDKPAKK